MLMEELGTISSLISDMSLDRWRIIGIAVFRLLAGDPRPGRMIHDNQSILLLLIMLECCINWKILVNAVCNYYIKTQNGVAGADSCQ